MTISVLKQIYVIMKTRLQKATDGWKHMVSVKYSLEECLSIFNLEITLTKKHYWVFTFDLCMQYVAIIMLWADRSVCPSVSCGSNLRSKQSAITQSFSEILTSIGSLRMNLAFVLHLFISPVVHLSLQSSRYSCEAVTFSYSVSHCLHQLPY